MYIEQRCWTSKNGWQLLGEAITGDPQLVLVFGDREQLSKSEHFDSLREMYPHGDIITCSTAGEICDTHVYENSLSVVAIRFAKTQITVVQTTLKDGGESEEKGRELAHMLSHEGLTHAMVFSDGISINGTALVKGLTATLPPHVSITGGLAGDGSRFGTTLTGHNAPPTEKNIILVGFYGNALKVGYGSLGGWDTFGLERTITRSKNNILYELDGSPALALYKKYLGDFAAELPSSGLLFPMRLKFKNEGKPVEVVRTILGVNEEEQSLTFAGDMPEGAVATLMRANFERLIDGAVDAAAMSRISIQDNPELAILISCVGRKLVLKDRVEDEIIGVRSALGENVVIAGFYSYGEICPQTPTEKQCALHNQTMTITTFKEM